MPDATMVAFGIWEAARIAREYPITEAARKELEYAIAQLGMPYHYGADNPAISGAFDCSSLAMWACRAAGIYIPRLPEEQWAWGYYRRVVATEMLLPGDLVYFDVVGEIRTPYHVGIVTRRDDQDNVTMIHAPMTGQRVSYAGLHDNPLHYYVGAIRPSSP